MKVKAPAFERALEKADPAIRLFLVHGQDDAGARAMATKLEQAMGAEAERIDLDGPTLRDDPARLADEAAAISLFGEKRWIRVTGGDECAAAIDALLTAPVAGNPVILIAGALKASGALLKRASADAAVLECQLYRPEAANLASLADALARPMGVRLGRGVAAALAAASLGDRAVIERELEKLALYADAAPDRPREIDLDMLAEIGASLDEADPAGLVTAVLDGNIQATDREIDAVMQAGATIPALRALSRRLIHLASLRSDMDNGRSADAVIAAQGRAIFWKDTDHYRRHLRRWSSPKLAIAQDRVFACEGAIMATGTAGDVLAAQTLVDIARVAERLG